MSRLVEVISAISSGFISSKTEDNNSFHIRRQFLHRCIQVNIFILVYIKQIFRGLLS